MSKTSQTLDTFRDLPAEELDQALVRTRDELFRLRLGAHTNQVASTAALATKRREIAKILTIQKARDLGIEKQGRRKARKES
jgi:large subunit ribosomal protein L29